MLRLISLVVSVVILGAATILVTENATAEYLITYQVLTSDNCCDIVCSSTVQWYYGDYCVGWDYFDCRTGDVTHGSGCFSNLSLGSGSRIGAIPVYGGFHMGESDHAYLPGNIEQARLSIYDDNNVLIGRLIIDQTGTVELQTGSQLE